MHSQGCKIRTDMKKQVYNKQKIDTNSYVNVDTGETLASEQPSLTSINVVNNDYVKYKSEEFYIIDDKALRYLRDTLSKADMYYVLLLTGMVRGSYNYLHTVEYVAHNRESLMRDLEIARNAFGRLLKRLTTKGVIMETKGYKDSKPFKYIMLNPNLARRSNTLSKECARLFQTFV